MFRHTRKLIHIASTLVFMLAGADAIAGEPVGIITYGPLQPIPALSGSMLVVLGFLFAVLAFRALRAHSASKPLASIVAVGVLVLGAASGNQLMQNAQATPPSLIFSKPSGGKLPVHSSGDLNVSGSGEQQVLNTSGQTQRVISVTPSSGYGIGSTAALQCTVGLTVQNNSSCYINFTGPSP
jgi:hypothetical protein